MLFKTALKTAALWASTTAAVTLTGYEYIVVGSGAGGGPVAARLALAGHKTLLIEAGHDPGADANYTVPAYQAKSTEDPELDWSFYVRHYADDTRQKRDFKLTYTLADGKTEYTGLNPPAGATIKGILYPRAQMLGGCTGHNALVSIYPDRSDFQNIATLTGDNSWNPDNMRKYFVKMENNGYLPPGTPGHGFAGWLQTSLSPIVLAVRDLQLTSFVVGGANALGGNYTNTFPNLGSVFGGDANADSTARDQTQSYYQIPISAGSGTRSTVREFLLSVANAKDVFGRKKYPLDIRLNSYVTKVTFDTTKSPPVATGVEFLDGSHIYRASPLSHQAKPGVPGSAKASREVIISGGSYNSPQILKLSGIGPAAELRKFGIPVIRNSPGVGTNLQDHYEVVVQGQTQNDFPALAGCTFGFPRDGGIEADPCYQTWLASSGPVRAEQTYASSGFAAGMFLKSTQSPDGNYDELGFGGPVNFRGYFPGYSYNATSEHNWWSWALLKSHPRNRAGSVTLRSADPLDTPNILFNYFDTGSGDYNADLETIYESITTARNAFANQPVPITERLPGAKVQSKADIFQYIKDTAWGHHCSSTVAIGADSDPNAVLDSSFRVRGVSGLRVVDASVYPRIPGTFTLLSTYLVGEKAADVILSQIK